MRVRLLHCLAGALVKHGVRFLLNLAPGGDVIYDIAADTWGEYRRGDGADAARTELEALAQAPAQQVQQAIATAVQEVAAKQPAAVQEALGAYLAQVPAAIRRSLRRPSDPTGSTMPPSQTIREAQDLVPFLPARLPRFKAGDRPLPGVDWELEELAGVGGFGEVWKARHPYLKSKPPVALKFCLDQSAIAALRNEAGVLDRVMQEGRHAGIVPLIHTYLSADPPCLEYEFVEGGDLTGLIQEMHARRRVKPEVANRLLLRLAEIVAFAHKAEPPIVHGDLKPANVLVRRTAEGKVALRVIDFGIGGLAAARAAQEVRQPTRSRPQLMTEAVRGAHTPLYASPEQMARRPGALADPRDDVHALGVIWFQLLTGDLAITSIPPDWREQLAERGVGEGLIQLVGACVAPKADKRPASAVVLVAQIKPMLELIDQPAVGPAKAEKSRGAAPATAKPEKPAGRPTVVRATTKSQRPTATGRPAAAKPSKNRWLAAGAGVAAVLLAIIGLWAGVSFLQDRQPAKAIVAPLPVPALPKDSSEKAKNGTLPKVTRGNYEKLEVGMTQEQLEGILGKGKLAVWEDADLPFGIEKYESKDAWLTAAREDKVYVWKGDLGPTILAGYFGDPRAGSKVVAFGFYSPGSGENVRERGSLRRITPENFAKATVGMTLSQLQESLGKGRRATTIKDVYGHGLAESTAWASAVARGRVQIWQEGADGILAAFTGDPSAGGKVDVLFHARSSFQVEKKPAGKWDVSPENFDKLKAGMTLKEVEGILGGGRLAIEKDVWYLFFDLWGPRRDTWKKAIKEGRVQIWRHTSGGRAVPGGSERPVILAAFPGDPSADSKVDVLFSGNDDSRRHSSYVQKPADKWVVNKDNFRKVKVGMTLKELEDIIGIGEKATKDNWNKGWQKAVQEYRVHQWREADDKVGRQIWIVAGFPEPPTSATKVEALIYRHGVWDEDKAFLPGIRPPLIYRRGVWDEDKGTLSGTKK